jgi:ketosteroid isomerase-like protein
MHPNAEKLRSAYEAYGRGDMDTASKDWTEDILWHVTGSTPIAYDRRGREEITQLLAELMVMTNGTFRITPIRFFADDDWGVAICRSTATIAGQEFDNLVVHLHKIVNGKTTESWFLDERPLEEDAAMQAAFELIASRV